MPNNKQTDWDHYYDKPYKSAGFTKPIIIKRMIHYIKTFSPNAKGFSITEFGGGNSCFYQPFMQVFSPSKYCIADNNQTGLEAFSTRFKGYDPNHTELLQQDILNLDKQWQSDIVFSVGLIEHFSVADTRKAIEAHLEVLKPGGLLILGFPTPTWLYRISRKVSELLGLWIFHDERPLKREEVLETLRPQGDILHNEILWSIIFTQAFIILKKHD